MRLIHQLCNLRLKMDIAFIVGTLFLVLLLIVFCLCVCFNQPRDPLPNGNINIYNPTMIDQTLSNHYQIHQSQVDRYHSFNTNPPLPISLISPTYVPIPRTYPNTTHQDQDPPSYDAVINMR